MPTLISGVADARAAFGRASMLDHMVAAFRRQNPVGELWAVALDDDGGGVKAVKTITVSSAATGAGTIALYVAGRRVAVPGTGRQESERHRRRHRRGGDRERGSARDRRGRRGRGHP